MSNLGIRISKEGVDVKTGADKDMVFTSKYPLLKGAFNSTSTVTSLDGYIQSWSYTHNLGYVPFMEAYVLEPTYGTYFFLPFQAGADLRIWTYTDSTKAYFKVYNTTGSDLSLKFKYFIYLDKAKL